MTNLVGLGQEPSFMQKTHYAAEKALEGAVNVKKDGSAFFSALKFGNYAFMGAECAFGNKKPITFMMQKTAGGMSVIDAFDLFSSLNYWTSGDFLGDWDQGKAFEVLGNATLTTASVGGFVLWLGELGFMDLAAISASIGNTPVIGGAFQAIAEIGLGSIVGGLVTVGYGFLAADALQNIINADNNEKRTKGILDLISSIAYVALNILLLISGICVAAIVVLGLIASGFGLASFLYKHYNKEAFN